MTLLFKLSIEHSIVTLAANENGFQQVTAQLERLKPSRYCESNHEEKVTRFHSFETVLFNIDGFADRLFLQILS
nr:MAG TPA: hypothetical protein [Caudoviricetes sp.]